MPISIVLCMLRLFFARNFISYFDPPIRQFTAIFSLVLAFFYLKYIINSVWIFSRNCSFTIFSFTSLSFSCNSFASSLRVNSSNSSHFSYKPVSPYSNSLKASEFLFVSFLYFWQNYSGNNSNCLKIASFTFCIDNLCLVI